MNRLDDKLDRLIETVAAMNAMFGARVSALEAAQIGQKEAIDRFWGRDWSKLENVLDNMQDRLSRIEADVGAYAAINERVDTMEATVSKRVDVLEKTVSELTSSYQQVKGAAWIMGTLWTVGTAIIGYLLGGRA